MRAQARQRGILARMTDDLEDVSTLLHQHGYMTAEQAAGFLNISPAGFRSYVARPSTGCPKPVAQITRRVPLWSLVELKAWQDTRQGRGKPRAGRDD